MHLAWQTASRAVAILAAMTFAACNKPVADEEPEPEPVVRATPPPATPVATPAIAAATPEPNYFAPPGVYYLVNAASVETPEGIVGLTPGAKLQKVGPGKFTAAGHQLDLRESQVTNDLRIAQRVAGADQAAQAALRQAMAAAAAQAANPSNANPAAPTATPNTVVATGQPKKPTGPPRGLGNSLGSSGALGKTRSQDGWIWQMDSNGNWQPLRPDK
jgi:hypothetical protein